MWSAEPTGSVATGRGGCRTACGDAGCECRSATPLHFHDHIALVAGDGTHLSCLCGDFQVILINGNNHNANSLLTRLYLNRLTYFV